MKKFDNRKESQNVNKKFSRRQVFLAYLPSSMQCCQVTWDLETMHRFRPLSKRRFFSRNRPRKGQKQTHQAAFARKHAFSMING